MKIAVGSTNAVKIQAVEEAIKEYLYLKGTVSCFSVPSDVSEQPLSLEETVRGAKNRAEKSFRECTECTFAFGIESGLFIAPGTQTGFLNVCVCAIFTGTNYFVGFSSGFEVPAKILALVIDQKMDLSQACYHSGITKNAKIGNAEGLIGILSKGKIDRKQYTKESVISALIQLDNAHLYDFNG